MNANTINIIEFDRIKNEIEEYALSDMGKGLVRRIAPSIDIAEIEGWMREISEAMAIIGISSSVPIHSLKGMESIMDKLKKGSVISADDLIAIGELLEEGKKLRKFMADKTYAAPIVSSYALSIYELTPLEDEIERCIRNGVVEDRASQELSRIRKKIVILEGRIKEKIESLLKNPRLSGLLQDSVVAMRNGRYVLPVRSEYRRQVEGEALDMSSSGSTVFIEPAEVKRVQEELNLFRIQEEAEVYRILSILSAMAAENIREININMEVMASYDFIFAKAKYCRSIGAEKVKLNRRGFINIQGGRHPLIKDAVPLNFTLGDGYRGLVITGPNTGGKTVVLKTAALLTIMAQSGLEVPVEEGSEIAVFNDILADIGDGQDIKQSLSTFSSHIKNIINIIACADSNTLAIMDELGAGTDPGEGMGLAESVLESVYKKGASILATTHYSEIKEFARSHEGFVNGCMEFDINTLKPLYRLTIGKTGESNAFLIALRLGMDRKIIERAHEITYHEKKDYSRYKFIPSDIVSDEAIKTHEKDKSELTNIVKTRERIERKNKAPLFKIGDCVYVSSMGRTGIVCEAENSKGEVGVMVMKKKFIVNKKRLSLYIDSAELYPEQYDLDIVLKSKEYRKKDKIMNKHHVEGLTIEVDKEQN